MTSIFFFGRGGGGGGKEWERLVERGTEPCTDNFFFSLSLSCFVLLFLTRALKSKFDLDVICCKMLNNFLKSRQQNRISEQMFSKPSMFGSGLKGGFLLKRDSSTSSRHGKDADAARKSASDGSSRRLKKAQSSGSVSIKRSLNSRSADCKDAMNPGLPAFSLSFKYLHACIFFK